MADVLPIPLDEYIDRLNAHDHDVAHEMEARAAESGFPIVGPSVGRVLYQLVLLHRPTRIFELGSGFGYSAFWFALGLRDGAIDGEVILTDTSQQKLDDARSYLDRAGLADACSFRCGDALDILDADEAPADVFFMDIDKQDYPRAVAPIMQRLRRGGLIVVDNMLWKGKVYEGESDAATTGVRALTEMLFEHEELVTTLLPIRDGVTLSLRRRSPRT